MSNSAKYVLMTRDDLIGRCETLEKLLLEADGHGQRGSWLDRRDRLTPNAGRICPECKASGGPDGVTVCATCSGGFWERLPTREEIVTLNRDAPDLHCYGHSTDETASEHKS